MLREMLLTLLQLDFNPLNHNEVGPINSIDSTQRENDYKTEDGLRKGNAKVFKSYPSEYSSSKRKRQYANRLE